MSKICAAFTNSLERRAFSNPEPLHRKARLPRQRNLRHNPEMQQRDPRKQPLWNTLLNQLKSIHNALPNVSPFLEKKPSAGLKLFIHGNIVTINTGRRNTVPISQHAKPSIANQ
ncbi:hypothetical protein [Pelagicoccus sp. SDUM812002]|uniref:hypothetical protein n=1 Tax=Pelagicoccus sp. SDUM812002 TaxID=3041266 RepID=UPI00280E9454|nr:hypothetical protein [Pelagicoccus sp. SDUM812002]MDQ8185026.1 hypothetical protein [Pelagicoccus sp. SDUM812002]